MEPKISCPGNSKCWSYDEISEKCLLNTKSETCVNLTCKNWSVEVEFGSDLFFTDQMEFKSSKLYKKPVFNDKRNLWQVSCDFQNCINYVADENFIDLSLKIAFSQNSKSVQNRLGDSVELYSSKFTTEISWTCRYSTSISVSSDNLELLNQPRLRNEIVKEGKIENAFKLRTYTNSAFTTPTSQGKFSNKFENYLWPWPIFVLLNQ